MFEKNNFRWTGIALIGAGIATAAFWSLALPFESFAGPEVPLHKAERRKILGYFDGRMLRQTILQELDPHLPDTGFAVRQACEMRSETSGQPAKHGLGIGQRNAADAMRCQRTSLPGLQW